MRSKKKSQLLKKLEKWIIIRCYTGKKRRIKQRRIMKRNKFWPLHKLLLKESTTFKKILNWPPKLSKSKKFKCLLETLKKINLLPKLKSLKKRTKIIIQKFLKCNWTNGMTSESEGSWCRRNIFIKLNVWQRYKTWSNLYGFIRSLLTTVKTW